eukprot:795674-Alexandrium_andersonii.AAC.1
MNVGSWQASGPRALELAGRQGAQVIALQEAHVRPQSVPGASLAARRFGWALVAAATTANQGGVGLAIAAREP